VIVVSSGDTVIPREGYFPHPRRSSPNGGSRPRGYACPVPETAVARAEREWWGRLPRALHRPRSVFAALRNAAPEDVAARGEPILLVIFLAGMAGVLLTSQWGRLLDDREVDAVIVAVFTFVGGGLYGAAGYFLLGTAVYLAARGVGAAGSFRLARQLVAVAAVPLAASLLVILPLRLALFGSDTFRSGGRDAGAAGAALLVLGYAFPAWSLVLLALGLRTVYGLRWSRLAGALALVALFTAALVVLPSAL
jgi:hypothetical protein